MRYSPLVLIAFPDGLLFSGNDIWVFTVLTGWDSLQAEWVPEGWLDGAAGRFMRRDGKQTAARAKTKVLPFGSSKSKAGGKHQPSRKQMQAPHKCSLFQSSQNLSCSSGTWTLYNVSTDITFLTYHIIIHYSCVFFRVCGFPLQPFSESTISEIFINIISSALCRFSPT